MLKRLAHPGAFFNSGIFLPVLVAVLLIVLAGIITYFMERPPVLPQRAISTLRDAAIPGNGEKVLVFSPHPDDETIGLGGFIALSERGGAEVRIVLVTDGNRHHNEAVRYSEFRAVTASLGVDEKDLVFLGLPDDRLREFDPAELRRLLAEQIDSYAPDVVLYPHPMDKHPDHAVIGSTVAGILGSGTEKKTAYEYLVHYKLLYPQPRKFDPALYLLPPRELTRNVEWLRVMLPQDIEDLKISGIFSYKSQLKSLELRDLMLFSIRRNELLAVPSQ